jgi:hypothetical protein
MASVIASVPPEGFATIACCASVFLLASIPTVFGERLMLKNSLLSIV